MSDLSYVEVKYDTSKYKKVINFEYFIYHTQ